MSFTPGANWLAAFARAHVEPRLLVEITDGTTSWKAVTGECTGVTYPPAIVSVSPLATAVGTLKKTIKPSNISIVVEDDWMRPIFVNNELKNQKVNVTLGAENLVEGDYEDYFVNGWIEDIIPTDGNTVEITVSNVLGRIHEVDITGAWYGVNPLEAVEDILLNSVDIPAALIDSSAFDPDDAANAAIANYTVSRGAGWRYLWPTWIDEPVKAFGEIEALSQIANGDFFVNESGQISFGIFDPTAAAVEVWTEDEYSDFAVESLYENIINRITVSIGRQGGVRPDDFVRDGSFQFKLQFNETNSQSDLAFPGATEYIAAEQMEHGGWLSGGIGHVFETDNSTYIRVTSHAAFGLTGMRDANAGGGQPSGAQVSSTYPAYFAVLDKSNDLREIIKSTSAAIDTEYSTHYIAPQPEDGFRPVDPATPRLSSPNVITYSSLSRQQLNSDSVTVAEGMQFVDITIAVRAIEARLKRHAKGSPIVSLVTDFSHYGVQLTDIVQITAPQYLNFGSDGTTDKWQVVKKEPDLSASPPAIKWELMWATEASYSATHVPAGIWEDTTELDDFRDLIDFGDRWQISIGNGLTWTIDSGLGGTLSAGRVTVGETIHNMRDTWDYTFTASKDTYVTYNTLSRSISFAEIANGGGAPTQLDHEIHLAKVVTDGSGITSIDESLRGPSRPYLVDNIDVVAFAAYQSSNQNLNKSPGADTIVFDTEEYDYGNNFASNTFTAPADGVYNFSARLDIDSIEDTKCMQIQLAVGGTIVRRGQTVCNESGGASALSAAENFGDIELNASDAVTIEWTTDNSTNPTSQEGQQRVWFTGRRVR